MAQITTFDAFGRENGFVVPIWNARTDDYKPQQVYLTAVLPGTRKGPHLHYKRHGRFCCVSGEVAVVTRDGETYAERRSGPSHGYAVIDVPVGTPAALYCVGEETALVINMPTPGWSPDDQDEHDVENWDYEPEGFGVDLLEEWKNGRMSVNQIRKRLKLKPLGGRIRDLSDEIRFSDGWDD